MSTANKTKWVIDPSHSEISFKVKHLMISNVKGVFREFSATVYTGADGSLTPEVEFSMNPASVDTTDPNRDGHLKSADFFDAEKFPKISFKGTGLEKKSESEYVLAGDLEIKGISKQVKLNVEFGGIMKDPWGNEKAGYTLEGKINRKDWELNWNAALETGGVLVSDEVRLSCEVQLLKQA